MPVSVVCDAASVVNAALRESIGNSSNNTTNCSTQHHNDDDGKNNLQNKLIASTKRVLLTKIEYEEVNNYNQSVIDTLKSKYIVLKPASNGNKVNQLPTGDSDNKETNQNTSTQSTTISGQQNGSKESSNQLPQPKRVLYPKENVQIGWRSSNRKWQIGAGMINVGNTCYLNSTLQALFHVPAMANWLVSDSSHREKCEDENGTQGGCIICAMSKTLISSQTNQSPIRPYLVYTKLKLVCKHLIMGRQEDAHEFLRYLVEAMEKSYLSRFRNWKELDQFSKETTPLNQILGGYLRSTVRCLACGHVSTTFQHFQDLLLDIRKANTVEEALDGYFARERLEDMGYKCEACKKKVSATKQFSLERAPVSLCIQLKRFSMMGTKLNKHVAIRPRLDLSAHASKKSSSCEQLTYRLVAMVTHLGASQHCGHYTAIGVTETGGYYQFDDSCVRPISLQNVLNTNAYIIFYELEDPHQQQQQYSLPTTPAGGKLTSTQVSGEHNRQLSHSSILEQIKENIHNKMNGQLILSNNNENVKPNNSSSSSVLNKGIPSTSSDTSSTIIGPQLPDKLLNGYKTESTKPTLNGLFSPTTTHKLIRAPTSSTSNSNASTSTSTTAISQSSPKQKPSSSQQSLNNKLIIHFKSTGNNGVSSNSSSILSPINSKFQGITSPSKNQLADLNKTQTDNISKKSTSNSTISNAAVRATLPSMPNLESPSQKNNTLVPAASSSSSQVRYLPNRNTLANVAATNSCSSSENSADKQTLNSSSKISPVKSLVPYESDDDSTSNGSDSEQQRNNTSKTLNNTNCNSNSSVHNSSKCNYIVLDECSSSSSSSSHSNSHAPNKTDRKSKTPPSPAVVKSKTGLWQVTSANIPQHTTTTANSSTVAATLSSSEKRNPFASSDSSSFSTGISTSSFYSSKMNPKDKKFNGNNNKKYEGGYTENHHNNNSNTVNQLLKFSHRGYGAPVLSWNGQKPEMEKELHEENRLERKRELKDDEENDMDRGRQKRIKTHNNNNSNSNLNGRDNSGYNPFQEYQSNQQQQRRWNHNNNNNNNSSNSSGNNGSNGNGRYHNQNGHTNNNLYNRQNNPFYRNHNNNNNNNFRNRNNNHHHRFNNNHHHHHHRPHHQRNGGGGGGDNSRFHHRRDS